MTIKISGERAEHMQYWELTNLMKSTAATSKGLLLRYRPGHSTRSDRAGTIELKPPFSFLCQKTYPHIFPTISKSSRGGGVGRLKIKALFGRTKMKGWKNFEINNHKIKDVGGQNRWWWHQNNRNLNPNGQNERPWNRLGALCLQTWTRLLAWNLEPWF